LLALVLALSAPAVHAAMTATVPAKFKPAEKLYRQHCGQCHALKEARAVGFGSDSKTGPGVDGGPSFNPLKIPYRLSVLAVLGTWDGHQTIVTRMTWKQIYDVAYFIQSATRDHRHLAKLPSDDFR
jgi:mono/diheme cytochrome c family protein